MVLKRRKQALETPVSALDALQQGRTVSSAGAAPSIARAVRSGYGTAAGIRKEDMLDTRTGQRKFGIEAPGIIRGIQEKEGRAGKIAQGLAQLGGQTGAFILSQMKLKEAADAKRLKDISTPDDPEQYKQDMIDLAEAFDAREDAKLAERLTEFAPVPGVNPEYDALSEQDKIAVQALAREEARALDAIPDPAETPTREQQIANLRAMEREATPVSAPAVQEVEPTPIREILLTDEEDAALEQLSQERAAFQRKRRADALAAVEERIEAAFAAGDAFKLARAQADKADIIRGDF